MGTSAVLHCPHCGQQYPFQDRWAGRKVKCNRCQQTFLVPGPAASGPPQLPSGPPPPTPPSPPKTPSSKGQTGQGGPAAPAAPKTPGRAQVSKGPRPAGGPPRPAGAAPKSGGKSPPPEEPIPVAKPIPSAIPLSPKPSFPAAPGTPGAAAYPAAPSLPGAPPFPAAPLYPGGPAYPGQSPFSANPAYPGPLPASSPLPLGGGPGPLDPLAAAAQPFPQDFPAPVLGGYPFEKRKARGSGSADGLTRFLLSHKLMIGVLACALLQVPIFLVIGSPVAGVVYAFFGFMIAPFGLLPTPRPYESIGGKILGALGTVFLILFLGFILCVGGVIGSDQSGELRELLSEMPAGAQAFLVFSVVVTVVFLGTVSFCFIRFGFFRTAAWGYIAYFGLLLPPVSLILRQAARGNEFGGRRGSTSDGPSAVPFPMPPGPFRPGPTTPSPSPSQPAPATPPLWPGTLPGRGPAPAAGSTADGRAAEQLAKDLVARLTELADLLSTIRDEATMRAATPKASTLVDRINALAKEAQELEARGRSELDPLQSIRLQAEAQRLTTRVIHETMRIQHIRGNEELLRELAKLRGGTGGPNLP